MNVNYIYWDGKNLNFHAKTKYNIILCHERNKLLIACSIVKNGCYGAAVYSLSKDLELYYFLGIDKMCYLSEEVDKTLLYSKSREAVIEDLYIRENMLSKEQKINILEKVLIFNLLYIYCFADGTIVSTAHGKSEYADSKASNNYFFDEKIFAFTGLLSPAFVQHCVFDFTILETRFKDKHGKHTDYEYLLKEYKKEIERIPISSLISLGVPDVYSDIYDID
jgi:hypothetical protein